MPVNKEKKNKKKKNRNTYVTHISSPANGAKLIFERVIK
jgi:hypothetical protein